MKNMKKNIKILLSIFLMLIVVQSCKKDLEGPGNNPPLSTEVSGSVKFSDTDIKLKLSVRNFEYVNGKAEIYTKVYKLDAGVIAFDKEVKVGEYDMTKDGIDVSIPKDKLAWYYDGDVYENDDATKKKENKKLIFGINSIGKRYVGSKTDVIIKMPSKEGVSGYKETIERTFTITPDSSFVLSLTHLLERENGNMAYSMKIDKGNLFPAGVDIKIISTDRTDTVETEKESITVIGTLKKKERIIEGVTSVALDENHPLELGKSPQKVLHIFRVLSKDALTLNGITYSAGYKLYEEKFTLTGVLEKLDDPTVPIVTAGIKEDSLDLNYTITVIEDSTFLGDNVNDTVNKNLEIVIEKGDDDKKTWGVSKISNKYIKVLKGTDKDNAKTYKKFVFEGNTGGIIADSTEVYYPLVAGKLPEKRKFRFILKTKRDYTIKGITYPTGYILYKEEFYLGKDY